MPYTAQQRTKSRRRFDPRQLPLPPVISLTAIRYVTSTRVELTFSGALNVSAVPPITAGPGNFATATEYVSPGVMFVDFAGAFNPETVISVPGLAQEWRGENGELVDGFTVAAAGGTAGALPPQVYILQATISGSTGVQILLSGPASGMTFPGVTAGIWGVESVTETTPTVMTLNFFGALAPGDLLVVTEWQAFSAVAERWLAPAQLILA